MNAAEITYALELASRIEAEAGELYNEFARASSPNSRERQFWQLLAYEEKTHSHMMDLIARSLDQSFLLPEDEVPGPLRNNMQGLRQFRTWLRAYRRAARHMAGDQFWMVRAAADLENSEADKVLDWLMMLPVAEETRELIREMTRGTTDHAERIKAYGAGLFKQPMPAEAEAARS